MRFPSLKIRGLRELSRKAKLPRPRVVATVIPMGSRPTAGSPGIQIDAEDNRDIGRRGRKPHA